MNTAGALSTHEEEENRNGRTGSDVYSRVQWLNHVREEVNVFGVYFFVVIKLT